VLVGILLVVAAVAVTVYIMKYSGDDNTGKNSPPNTDGKGLLAGKQPKNTGDTKPDTKPNLVAGNTPPVTPDSTGNKPPVVPTLPAVPTPPTPTNPAPSGVATTTNPPSPTTTLIGSDPKPPGRPEIGNPHPAANPDMANAVASLPPVPKTSDVPVPTIITEPWRDSLEQGDSLVKTRDFDGAMQAYERAVDQAERATPAVSPIEIARVHQKMGDVAVRQSSPAEARGNYENAKRALQRVKGKSPEATQLMNDLETVLRRLPRE